MEFIGRRVLYTNKTVDASTIVDILNDAIVEHGKNSSECEYLYKYYKGRHPILDRIKDVRPEICNKVVVNRANEIVSFKTGYLMGEPVQYVSRGDDVKADLINTLNDFMFVEDKASKDKELADWMHICGTAFRMVMPNKEYREEFGDSPFHLYNLDPRYTFVIYSNDLGEKPVLGVKYVLNSDGDIVYSCYTGKEYFEIVNGVITKSEKHSIGMIPIVEYPANKARLGAFEIVLSLLDAIDTTVSNRIDGVEQFVQALMVFKGVDIEADDFTKLRELGAIKVPENGDVTYLIQELNQTQTQTLIDDMYQTVLTICGMPSTGNGTTSDSSNNGAVILRNGWQSAEARAKDTELMFKRSEKDMLRIAMKIARDKIGFFVRLVDIEIRFTRRNYENIQTKAQVLIQLLSNPKIHPRTAFEYSGMFVDPELAYTDGMAYYEQYMAEQEKVLASAVDANTQASAQEADDEE